MSSEKILLIQMPWATVRRPSIALGILHAICEEKNVAVDTLYPNLDLAATIGYSTANAFASHRAIFGLSEHLFAVDLFGKDALNSDPFIDSVCERLAVADSIPHEIRSADFVKRLRDQVIPGFLQRTLERIVEQAPTVVGFGATFNQVMGGLALAARIKSAMPDVEIIAGGACYDDEMGLEYQRALPQILDRVFIGESEPAFREYLERRKAGKVTHGIVGVSSYSDGRVQFAPGVPLNDMNDSPTPNYDSYVREQTRVLQETGQSFAFSHFPFESSRGCWWGQKNQCTFCGINPAILPFRAKDVDRALNDIVTIAERYGAVRLTATDWIMARSYYDTLFEKLKALDLDLHIFFETRAEMKKHQLKLMRDAGVAHIQPGIESFSTPLLRLMKKGTTAIRHVQFLRYCREVGMHVSYNMLGGFPSEDPQWYHDMAILARKLLHLEPPGGNMARIEMHRFSPLYEGRDALEMTYQLESDYLHNFPEGFIDPLKFGYFFEYTSKSGAGSLDYFKVVDEAIAPWRRAHNQPTTPIYEYMIGPGFVDIMDARGSKEIQVQLRGLARDVALLCDSIQSIKSLRDDLLGLYSADVLDERLEATIAALVQSEILINEGNQYLLLPIGQKLRSTEELRNMVLRAQPGKPTSESASVAVGAP
jgi:ribosomal peptide maturation radical SAM protein 1